MTTDFEAELAESTANARSVWAEGTDLSAAMSASTNALLQDSKKISTVARHHADGGSYTNAMMNTGFRLVEVGGASRPLVDTGLISKGPITNPIVRSTLNASVETNLNKRPEFTPSGGSGTHNTNG